MQLGVGQPLPRRGRPCQAWVLVSGLLCLGRAQPLVTSAAVYGVAAPGDIVGLPAEPGDAGAWAFTPCVLQAWVGPAHAVEWPDVMQRLCTQHWRQAAELAQLRSGGAADRVRQLLLMLARCGQAEGPLPSLRAMSQLVDAAPETVSRVLGALRELQLLQTAPGGRRRAACRATPQLVACALPAGLTGSNAVPRRARLQALRGAPPSSPWPA